MQPVNISAQIAQIVVHTPFVVEWSHMVLPIYRQDAPALTSWITESQRLHCRTPRLLPSLQRKMSPPILLIAGLRMFIARLPLFPIRHHGQTVRTDTEFDQIVPNGFRSFLTEYKIIGGGSTLVTVPFDLDERSRI